jgi:hypothetical protein
MSRVAVKKAEREVLTELAGLLEETRQAVLRLREASNYAEAYIGRTIIRDRLHALDVVRERVADA